MLYALGSLDAAEAELRTFIAENPNDARKEEAVRLLAEVRIEKERARLATTSTEHSGAVANTAPDITTVGAAPRVVDPAILSAPVVTAPLKWDRSFPGVPDQFRKAGIYAVSAVGEGAKTSIKIHFEGQGAVAHQRIGSMLVIDISEIVDALPRGGLDLPSGGASRIRHSQHSTEPLIARVVIDLKNNDVKATVTPAQDEVIILLEDPTMVAAQSDVSQGGLYRTPVSTATHKIEIAGGNFQRALVADALPEALAARVTAVGTGAPLAGVVVDFYAPDAGVQISPRSTVTGADGIATSRITLDEIAGRKIVMARLPGTPAEASFEIYGLARPPDSLRKISGEDAKVFTRQISAEPLVVVVQDKFGNPIPGVEVEWTFISGGGSVDADPDRAGNQTKTESDKDGRAVLRQWTAGAKSGEQKIQASFTSGEITKFVHFTIDVTPQLVSMDFFNTSVPNVLRFLGRIAGWNLILSDGVSNLSEQESLVTFHFENLPVDEVLDKILAMKKLTRIDQPDGSIKIVTLLEAQTQGQEIVTDAALLDQLPQDVARTVVLDVRPGPDFAAVVAALTPLLSAEGKIISDPASRKIVVTDYVSTIRRMRDILAEFEKGSEHRILTFENLNFTSPALQEFVRGLLPPEMRHFLTGNTIILLGSGAEIARVESILRAMDTSEALIGADVGPAGKTFEVVTLRSQKAVDLAAILQQLFQTPSERLAAAGITQIREEGTAGTTRTTTRTGTGADATTTTQEAPTSGPGLVRTVFQELKDQVKVVAEPRTNSLILYGYASDIATVKGVIQRLDSFELAKEPLTRDKITIVPVKYRTATEVLAAIQRIMFPSDAAAADKEREEASQRALSRSLTALYWFGGMDPSRTTTGATYGGQVGSAAGDYTATETQPIPLRMFEIPEPNMIVIVGGNQQERDLVQQLIEEIDASENNRVRDGVYMEVYNFTHLLPSEFNKILEQTVLSDEMNDADLWYWWYFGRRRGTSEVRRMPLDASMTMIVFARRLTHAQIANLLEKVDNPKFATSSQLAVKTYPVRAGEIYAVASILTRSAVNQTTDITDEFIFVDQLGSQIIVWAREAAHMRVERLLPQIDKPELRFDPLLKYEIYEFQNISVSEVIGVTTSAEREIVEQAAGFGQATVATRDKTILQLIAEPLGTDPGRGIYPSITGNFILVWGPTAQVDRSIEFARQIDRRWERSQIQVRTYRVEHGDPKNVVSFINSTIFAGAAVVDAAVTAAPNPEFLVLDSMDSAVFHVWAVPATHRRVATFLNIVDTTPFRFGKYRVFYPRALGATEMSVVLERLYPALRIEVVEDANSVVVFGDQAGLDEVEGMFRQIDVDGIVFDSYVFRGIALHLWWDGLGIEASFPGVRFVRSSSIRSGNYILMWGPISNVRRAKDYVMQVDQAAKNHVGGETMVRMVDIIHRPAQEVFTELNLFWGFSQYMSVLTRPESPRNAIMLFLPPDRIDEVTATIRMLDTTVPTRVYRSAYLHTQPDLENMVRGLFPSLQVVVIASTAAGGFEQVVVRGPQAQLDQLSALWAQVDTPGRIAVYRARYLPHASALAALREFMAHGPGVNVTGRLGSEAIVIYGESARVDEALAFLRMVDVDQPARLLKYGRMTPDEAVTLINAYYPNLDIQQMSNGAILVAMGNPETLSAAERLLAEVEQGLQFRVVSVGAVADVVAMLGTMLPSLRVSGSPTLQTVAMLGTEANLAEAMALIGRITSGAVSFIPVGEADVAQVVTLVQELFPEAQVRSFGELNTLLVTADTDLLREIEGFVRQIDRKLFTAIRPLRYYDPTTSGELPELERTLRNYLTPTTGQIFFDRQSNAYVITDALDRVDKVLKLLEDLDRAPPQFMIEAVIAEVALTDNKNLGFTWQFRPDLTDFGFLPSNRLTAPAAGGGDVQFASSGNFSFGVARNNLQATVTTLLSTADARVVATPKIVTRNNIQGQVNLQQSFPVVTPGAITATGAQQPPTTTFQAVPIVLTVTPSSTWSSDAIRLTVRADISVPGEAVATGARVTSSRIVNTTVDMRDGQTLIIGGLMQKVKNELISKIPFLGDLPGIGQIFRNTTMEEQNREVLIFLSPRIMYPATHDLQMEEELNRFKYLVNFPVDWSGRRWLINNQRRTPDLRAQMRENTNFILQPPPAPGMTAPPSIEPTVTPLPTFVPAPVTPPPSQPQFLGGVVTTYDVNTVTAAELRTIPEMPAHVAELIVAYRQANGPFASINDLLNVPGMTIDLFEKIRKYLRTSAETTFVSPPPAPAPVRAPAPQPQRTGRVNINTATAAELMSLPGISEPNARMIIAYRNTYGSFQTTAQLIDVPGITPEMYSAIRDRVTVEASAMAPAPQPQPAMTTTRININTAGEAQLATIAEFSTQNVKLIIAYRNQYGRFSAIEDLLNVPSITPELLSRVRDRLTVDGSEPTTGAARVNLNTATEAQLRTIPEFTEQNVKLIIAYRNSYGPFQRVEDLLDVPSITQELFDRVRNRLTVQ